MAKQEVFDAVVVGSGATGGWAAKELTRMGLRVAVVEALHQREPESQRASLAAVHPAVEGLEDAHLLARSEAGPRVLHAEGELPGAVLLIARRGKIAL